MRWISKRGVVAPALLALAVACGSADDKAVEAPSAAVDATVATTAPVGPTSGPATPPCTPEPSEPSTADQTSAPEAVATTGPPVATGPTTATTNPSTASSPSSSATSPAVDAELASRQAALSTLGYWLGETDGLPGSMTAHAVTAFQKAEGLDRTGDFDATTVDRLAAAERPQGRSGSGTVVEVDLVRQILLVVSEGRTQWIFDIATGAAATPTPPGEFSIYNEIDGYRHAPLGTLYRPKYFNGGIALHGYTSVPSQPASHGCVRMTYPAMDFLWEADLAPLGMTVLVY